MPNLISGCEGKQMKTGEMLVTWSIFAKNGYKKDKQDKIIKFRSERKMLSESY